MTLTAFGHLTLRKCKCGTGLILHSGILCKCQRCGFRARSTKTLFFCNRHCNPCGFWTPQLSLNILSGKVFTEWRCQRHVKPPTWRTSDLERSNSRHKESPVSETTQAKPSSGRLNYGREIAENFAESGHFHFTFVYFYVPYIYDIDRRLYFPSEGRRTVDFFARKKLI